MLEPEVMDSREDAWDYDSMDHGEVNRRFVEDLLAAGLIDFRQPETCGTDSPQGGTDNRGDCQWSGLAGKSDLSDDDFIDDRPPLLVLDIGAGTAQIPILLCQATDNVQIIAADAAVSMLDLARLNVEIAGLRDRIQLDHADAKQMAYRDRMFDVVISNSIVHHIPEPRAVLREAVRVTKPGGLLFFRDLVRPADDDEVMRLVELYAAGCNEHQQMLFRDSLRASLTLAEVQSLVSELGFAADTARTTSDRHWTWSARKPA
jgi:2-polyprenyl-3-methyl-5-hydroxy-6-metoxy-1,4-benzoquinol methylase